MGDDPQAERRLTQKDVRDLLIRKTVDAYLRDPTTVEACARNPKLKRGLKQRAISYAQEGFESLYGVKLHERTIYEALRPSSRSREKRKR